MSNGNGNGAEKDGVVGPLLKVLFGDAGRFVLLGIGIAVLYNAALNFKKEVMEEAVSTREILNEYIASNRAWQDLSDDEQKRIVRKVNLRIRRLYERNGWVYEEIDP